MLRRSYFEVAGREIEVGCECEVRWEECRGGVAAGDEGRLMRELHLESREMRRKSRKREHRARWIGKQSSSLVMSDLLWVMQLKNKNYEDAEHSEILARFSSALFRTPASSLSALPVRRLWKARTVH